VNGLCGLPNCQIVNNFVCRQCITGYALSQSCMCQPVDPYCLIKNNINVCLKCKEGYQLGQNGLCTTLQLGCNYVDGRCTSCRAPFVYVPATSSCAIDGCLSYFVGGCQNCSTGYSLLYNSCALPNCLLSKSGKCLQCNPDFVFRSDGTCVSKDEYCAQMGDNGTCLVCMSNYYFSQSLQRCMKRAAGCQYDCNDKCVGCNAPFTFQQGQCVIKGCLSFNEEGCVQCQYPFVLSVNKTCVIANCIGYDGSGHCSACTNGFALTADFLCRYQDQYCQQYDANNTVC
jgi:hypothetical protein